jgi:transcriptional regulator with XRE-family HTH domain
MYKLSVSQIPTLGFILEDTFGKQLKKWRETVNIKQAELARRLKVSTTYVSQLERDYYPNSKSGKGRPSEEIVERISRVLKVPIDQVRIAAGYAPKQKDQEIDDALAKALLVDYDKLSKKDKEFLRPYLEMFYDQVRKRLEN